MAARGLAIAATLLLAAALASAQDIAIMHFNDNHARFEPADVNFGTQCDGDLADVCFGGFARQATAITAAKAAASARGADSLVFHAGDQYTGSLWDAVYTKQGIQVAPQFLSQLGVQAFTLGNHEFDNGIANLAGFIGNISGAFPVLSCNVDISREPALQGLVQRYALIDLPLSNITVGVVGLTSVETPQTSNPGATVSFLPYNETLPACVADAREEGAQLIIALTHIGYDQDLLLAADPAAAGVHLIIGGHTHTLLYGEPAPVTQPQVAGNPPAILASPVKNETIVPLGPYPTLTANSGSTIPIVQALYGSRYLGVLDTTWDAEAGQLVSVSGSPVLLGGKNSTNPVAEDPVIAQQLAELRVAIDDFSNTVVGDTSVNLDGEREDVRNGETNLGDLLCQAVYDYAANNTGLFRDHPGLVPVCLLNAGVIRASIPVGSVTQGQVTTVSPFGNYFLAKKSNASTLLQALNSGLSGWTGDYYAQGRFPQVGGLRYAFNPTLPADSRLVNAELLFNGTATPLSTYPGGIILLISDYLAGGGDFYTMFTDLPVLLDSSTPLDEILAEHFLDSSPITTNTDGRIVNCANSATNPLCATGSGGSGAGAQAPTSPPPAAAAPPPSAALPRMASGSLQAAVMLLGLLLGSTWLL